MSEKKKIYTVATSHLDTVWSWDFEQTVRDYIYDTLVQNFEMFEKYPSYIFSFEGAYRYELMQEYYPELFEKLKEYVAAGRWRVTGSAYENGDVNVPSPEALFRNILLGNSYFEKTFGKRSCDIFLPDCFGFGYALPSIMAHANLKGFTTQKLTWGSAYGTPFDVGIWKGVDGNSVYASTDPKGYSSDLDRNWEAIPDKLKKAEESGLGWTYIFHGTGDRGGSPREKSIAFADEKIRESAGSDVEVIAAGADEIYRDLDKLPDEKKAKLPVWDNELVMTNHAVGGYTSRAVGKRWNRRCEELADAAECASVFADKLGLKPYDRQGINRAWKRFIAHQFHDDIPGTSCQRVYKRSWNDYAVSMNQFSTQSEAALGAISSAVDTSFCKGIPVLVFNRIERDRKEAVRIRLPKTEKNYRAYDCGGEELACQKLGSGEDYDEIVITHCVPSMGYAVVDIVEADSPCAVESSVSASNNALENDAYSVRLDLDGNVCSIFDKKLGRELLSEPIRTGLFAYKGSTAWPAWEMVYDEQNKREDRNPVCVAIEKIADGPAYAAIKVTQKDGDSVFNTVVSLSDGAERVEFSAELDWRGLETMAKQVFPLSAANEKATFDLGLGAIERGSMTEKLYEVPAQKWADITDESGDFGVSVLSECKYGWDKFNDSTLRMTIVHTPERNYKIDSMQSMMDLGLNRYSFAVTSHEGAVGEKTQYEARAFTAPMQAVVCAKHKGKLEPKKSFCSVSDGGVIIRAVKLCEDSDEVVVRLGEGQKKTVRSFSLSLGDGIESAREIYADETPLGRATVKNGELRTSFKPYQVRSFALKLKDMNSGKPVKSTTIKTDFDKRIAVGHGEYSDFEYAVPIEQYPSEVISGNVSFSLDKGGKAFVFDGRELKLPRGASELHLLCAVEGYDRTSKLLLDGKEIEVKINSALERFARWDFYDFNQTAYIKKGKIAFEATHSLKDGEIAFAKNQWFYDVTVDVSGVKSVTLPVDDSVVVLAVSTVSKAQPKLAYPLYDEVEERECTFRMTPKQLRKYKKMKQRQYLCDKDGCPEDDGRGIDY